MTEILKLLSQNSALVILFLLVAVIGLGITSVRNAIRLRTMQAKWESLLSDASGENLERLLYEHLRGRIQVDHDLEQLRDRASQLEMKMQSAKRYTGIVHYDAFPDVGGQQSFAFALYDELGHGIVLSSIVGRSNCRVFCKDIVGGKAQRELTDEERRALEMAAKRRAEALSSA
ncbi:MAG: DUF4446 family protein [Chthonomonas sp.]|nr:DUF4446 family protein [Chthonomonas sp.]